MVRARDDEDCCYILSPCNALEPLLHFFYAFIHLRKLLIIETWRSRIRCSSPLPYFLLARVAASSPENTFIPLLRSYDMVKPWGRCSDFVDNGYAVPKSRPEFKRRKCGGFRKPLDRHAFLDGNLDQTARRPTETKTYRSRNFSVPRRELKANEQKLALEEKSSYVTETGVRPKRGVCGWHPSLGRREFFLHDDDSRQKSLVENDEASPRAKAGLEVPKRTLQHDALERPTNYKGVPLKQFQHAFTPLIDEIKSQGSDDSKSYGTSSVAELKMTHGAKSDDVVTRDSVDAECVCSRTGKDDSSSLSSFENNSTVVNPSSQATNGEEEFQFGDKIVILNTPRTVRVPSDHNVDDEHHRLFYYFADNSHIQELEMARDLIYLVSDLYNVDDSRRRVKEAINLFRDVHSTHSKAYDTEKLTAAMALKSEKKWVNSEKCFVGHVPGIEIGDEFGLRAELAIVGLHHEFVCGIDFVRIPWRKSETYAVSIVDSGRYENQQTSPNTFEYVGHGGNPRIDGKKPKDQRMVSGNLALKNNRDKCLPVRVIRGTSETSGTKAYIYEGLYFVTKCWEERSEHGKMVFKYQLQRASPQPTPPSFAQQLKIPHRSSSSESRDVSCALTVVNDISQGKEKSPIRVLSDLYAETPRPFKYTKIMLYPHWYRRLAPPGCDCTNGCSDSIHCYCAYKNGGKTPFNSQGSITVTTPIIYECGPSCKCPPSCPNRVTQRGLRYHLEIFRKVDGGWGVRSRNFISAGSFVCEFVGELLKDDSQKPEEPDNGEGFVHGIGGSGFKIDAQRWGNVARFINRGPSPNLYVQKSPTTAKGSFTELAGVVSRSTRNDGGTWRDSSTAGPRRISTYRMSYTTTITKGSLM
ncbi:unnamed protein product [Cuscuta campestris]|uniref:YDG domain-containing protein n=1 Tax=Cuscuta campestris TaxID=132261 RepID=A0A484L964_9ASTE|nr:unnamed protein product [Cuscuta campestris]